MTQEWNLLSLRGSAIRVEAQNRMLGNDIVFCIVIIDSA